MAQRFSEQQLAQLWIKAGGDPKVAGLMAKLAKRESGGVAHINNAGLNKNGSVDYGLWQINSIHGYDPNKLYDPLYNAKAAVAVYKSQGPKAWATYNPSIDQKYLSGFKSSGKAPKSSTPSYSARDTTRQQIALSLLGMGGGSDPLDMAIQTALSAAQAPAPAPAPSSSTASYGGTQRTGGRTTFDGKPVVGWIADVLAKARKTGLWHGSVTSGIRTKQQQLSAAKNYGLQHYPNGPLASNHVEGHTGAVDVSDPQGLKAALRKIGAQNRLKSSMPEDPVHFSRSGY